MKNKKLSQARFASSMLGQRRGFLLAEETLKMVIALISISFLIFFITSLYFGSINSQKLEQAKSTIGRTETVIQSLKESETQEQDLPNPMGWYLFSFTGNMKPNSCVGQNCMCICDRVIDDPIRAFFTPWEERQAKECGDNGTCLPVSGLGKFSEIEIKPRNLTEVLIKKQDGEILVSKK